MRSEIRHTTRRALGITTLVLIALVTYSPPAEAVLSCNPSGTYCYGQFDDLIQRIRIDEGDIRLWLQQGVLDSLVATGVCVPANNVYVVLPGDADQKSLLLNQITVGRALGARFRLDFRSSATGTCEVARVFEPY